MRTRLSLFVLFALMSTSAAAAVTIDARGIFSGASVEITQPFTGYKADAAARTAWRVGAAVLAMLVVALLARIPVVGGFVALVTLVLGVGMIVGAILHRAPRAPAAA